MNFERGKDPKEALGIGLMGESLTITGIGGKIEVSRRNNNGNTKRTSGVLIKRWFIPLKFILFLLRRDRISSRLLSLFFYLRSDDCSPGLTRLFESLGLGMVVRGSIRKIRREGRYSKIDFNSSGWRLEELGDKHSHSQVSFSIKTSDVEKAAKLNTDGKEIKGVIYNGRAYSLGKNVKELTL